MAKDTEQNKTLEALQIAVQMETDGKEYYLKSSQKSSNEVGRKLLQSLATEEDYHRGKFEEISSAIRRKEAWPTTDFQPDGGQKLRIIFTGVVEETGSNIESPSTELDTVQTAMDMENKAHDFYKSRKENATYDAERDFYETLAAEEKEHRLILLDYYEYLKDPEEWFVGNYYFLQDEH